MGREYQRKFLRKKWLGTLLKDLQVPLWLVVDLAPELEPLRPECKFSVFGMGFSWESWYDGWQVACSFGYIDSTVLLARVCVSRGRCSVMCSAL